MGKLIVIEGVDSSGKETQANLLYDSLKEAGNVIQVSFPDYDSDFCIPVKRYLAGDLGNAPDDVNAFAASAFYAIDRFASFKRGEWGSVYRAGGTVIADRYVTSNLVHQASKLSAGKEEFIEWLSDLEYQKFGLPIPDLVIFLDMPPQYAQMLMRERKNKITGEDRKDIHENNQNYLQKSYDNAVDIARLCGWKRVPCVSRGTIRTIEEIHNEIVSLAAKV